MTILLYHILILGFGLYGVVAGFRRGFAAMMPAVLGMVAGAASAHAFGEDLERVVMGAFPDLQYQTVGAFAASIAGGTLAFSLAFLPVFIITGIALRTAGTADNILNCLGGALAGGAAYLLAVSLLLNFSVCLWPRSVLMHHAMADDGNLISAVMWLAPCFTGALSHEDLGLTLQLEDAKKISSFTTPSSGNYKTLQSVLPMEDAHGSPDRPGSPKNAWPSHEITVKTNNYNKC